MTRPGWRRRLVGVRRDVAGVPTELELVELSPPRVTQRWLSRTAEAQWRRGCAVALLVVVFAVLCAGSPSRVVVGPLLADRTDSVLWFFDEYSRLNRIELDTGRHRTFNVDSGYALLELRTQVVVFRGDGGADVIEAHGTVLLHSASPGVIPLTDPDSDTLWARDGTDARGERVWRRYPPPYVEPDTELLGRELGQPVALAGTRLLMQSVDATGEGTVSLLDVDSSATTDLGDGCAMGANDAAVIVRRPCRANATVWAMNLRLQTPWIMLVTSLPTSYAGRDYRLSPDGRLVAVPTAPGPQAQLQVYDTSTGTLVATGMSGANEWTWTRDSRYLIVAAGSNLLAWRIRDGNRTPLHRFYHYAQLAITR